MEVEIEPLTPLELFSFSLPSIPMKMRFVSEDYGDIEDWAVRQEVDDQKAEGGHKLCVTFEKNQATDACMVREYQNEDNANNYTVDEYQCDTCKQYYSSKSLLLHHIVRMHGKNAITKLSHECKICLKTFSYKAWHHHMSTVHSKISSKCHLCSKKFKADVYLKRHIKYVHDKVPKPESGYDARRKKYKTENCQNCNKTFKNKDCLNKHFKNVHSGDGKKFTCEICSSQLKSKSYLQTHMRRVHYDDGKKHRCGMCFKSFRSPRYLNIHKKNANHRKTKLKDKIKYESDDSDF